jgi:hypothetical protein
MYSHVIELSAKPGLAKDLINTIRDQAIPQIIRGSEGFVDERRRRLASIACLLLALTAGFLAVGLRYEGSVLDEAACFH